MRIGILAIILAVLNLAPSFCAEGGAKDRNQLFYQANTYYEEKDYVKALQNYDQVSGMGIESGNLYYNIGNSFFKLGKIGYAILFFEKAKRIMPQDSDLKSNLAYARSLVGTPIPYDTGKDLIVRMIKKLSRNLNLSTISISAITFYLMAIALSIVFILNPSLARKLQVFAFLAFLIVVFLSFTAFLVRYYDEEILKHGIVVQKEVEAKYEPIDKASTHYTLEEGNEVLIIKTREGWRQIKRSDGKIAWVKSQVVGEM